MEMISQDIDILRILAAKLEPDRKDSAIVNDLFEAADDWKNLGQMMFKYPAEQGFDLSGRVQQEVELFDRLQIFYGIKLRQNTDYAKIMEAGARLIAVGKQLEPHPDGPLGATRIVRETFAFLQSEFGLLPGQTPDTSWNYASDRVCVELDFPTQRNSWCRIIDLTDPPRHEYPFQLEDLLFMGGRSVSLALQPGQTIATEADVRAWFTTVADVLRQYGSDVLADRPGAFGRLAAAQTERERLYIEECERWQAAQASNGSEST